MKTGLLDFETRLSQTEHTECSNNLNKPASTSATGHGDLNKTEEHRLKRNDQSRQTCNKNRYRQFHFIVVVAQMLIYIDDASNLLGNGCNVRVVRVYRCFCPFHQCY